MHVISSILVCRDVTQLANMCFRRIRISRLTDSNADLLCQLLVDNVTKQDLRIRIRAVKRLISLTERLIFLIVH